jgi:hypothetical protein
MPLCAPYRAYSRGAHLHSRIDGVSQPLAEPGVLPLKISRITGDGRNVCLPHSVAPDAHVADALDQCGRFCGLAQTVLVHIRAAIILGDMGVEQAPTNRLMQITSSAQRPAPGRVENAPIVSIKGRLQRLGAHST